MRIFRLAETQYRKLSNKKAEIDLVTSDDVFQFMRCLDETLIRFRSNSMTLDETKLGKLIDTQMKTTMLGGWVLTITLEI
jgi:hypothetical protein